MRSTDSPIWFAMRALALYALFVLPAMLVRDAYSATYSGVANAALYAVGLSDQAVLRALEEPDGTIDSRIVLFDRATGAFIQRRVTPWRQGFLPTAAVAALVLATNLQWRRRLYSLAVGLVAVHVFVGLRLALSLLSGMNGTAPWCIVNLGPPATAALTTVEQVFVHTTPFAYVVAALIWIAVTSSGNLEPRIKKAEC